MVRFSAATFVAGPTTSRPTFGAASSVSLMPSTYADYICEDDLVVPKVGRGIASVGADSVVMLSRGETRAFQHLLRLIVRLQPRNPFEVLEVVPKPTDRYVRGRFLVDEIEPSGGD